MTNPLTPPRVDGPTPLPPAVSRQLLADLQRDEGCRLSAYQDTSGIWTIGYGHAHVEPGTTWTQDECEAALIADLQETMRQLDAAQPWWRGLDPVRRDALCNLAFNLGVAKLGTFTIMLGALKTRSWRRAADALMRSRYAVQVGQRATRLAQMIASGER